MSGPVNGGEMTGEMAAKCCWPRWQTSPQRPPAPARARSNEGAHGVGSAGGKRKRARVKLKDLPPKLAQRLRGEADAQGTVVVEIARLTAAQCR